MQLESLRPSPQFEDHKCELDHPVMTVQSTKFIWFCEIKQIISKLARLPLPQYQGACHKVQYQMIFSGLYVLMICIVWSRNQWELHDSLYDIRTITLNSRKIACIPHMRRVEGIEQKEQKKEMFQMIYFQKIVLGFHYIYHILDIQWANTILWKTWNLVYLNNKHVKSLCTEIVTQKLKNLLVNYPNGIAYIPAQYIRILKATGMSRTSFHTKILPE